MAKIGVPVPPGFTISTEVCDYYYKNGNKYPADLQKQIDKIKIEEDGKFIESPGGNYILVIKSSSSKLDKVIVALGWWENSK
jgi:pyruvate,orthophosphate dikinase